MKQGWKICKLGQVTTFQRGLTYGKSDESVGSSSNIVLRSNNIDLDTHSLDLSELKYLIEDYDIPQDKFLKKGSLFMCMSNGSKQHIGKVAYIDKDYPYAFGGFMGQINPTSSIEGRFLYYSCISSAFKSFLSTISNGINISNLKFSDLSDYPIPLPPLPVQQQIVSELDLLTSIINKKKAQLDELNKLAQATFYDMFGDPVENEKGWEVKKLGESTSIVGGYAFKSDLFTNKGIPVLRIGNINSGTLKDENICYYSEDVKLSRYVVYPQDLVMSLTGTVGKDDYGNVCVLPNTYEKYYLNQRNAKIEIHNSLIVRYLQYLLTDKKIKTKITGNSRGVRQANISNKDLETLPIPLPPLPLQQQFAQKIELIESQKSKIKASLAETQTLLDATMDRYFG